MSDLLTYARETVGVAMGSKHQGRCIGYTTDAVKAQALRDAGAVVTHIAPQSAGAPHGFEITFLPGATVLSREP